MDPTDNMTYEEMEKLASDYGWHPIIIDQHLTKWYKTDESESKYVREVCREILRNLT